MLSRNIQHIRDEFSCTVKEGELLYRLASRATGAIVEIGSWKGYSTIWLASGSICGNKVTVYAVDTFGGDIHNLVSGEGSTYSEFRKNIEEAGLDSVVIPIVTSSAEAARLWSIPVRMLFLDGDHDDIENDFARWYPHLVVGGFIALHDTVQGYNMLPYKVAVRELYKSGNFKDIGRVGCITYARRSASVSRWSRLSNKYALFSRRIYQLFFPCYIGGLQLGEKIIGILGHSRRRSKKAE